MSTGAKVYQGNSVDSKGRLKGCVRDLQKSQSGLPSTQSTIQGSCPRACCMFSGKQVIMAECGWRDDVTLLCELCRLNRVWQSLPGHRRREPHAALKEEEEGIFQENQAGTISKETTSKGTEA